MRIPETTSLHVSRLPKAAAGLLLLLAPAAWVQAQWAPSQPVEIIVGFSPGGGTDRTVRKINRIFQEKNFLANAVVVNKPGGAGSVGWAYLDQHAGNAHYVALATLTLLTNNITGRSKYNHTDFTPLAQLFTESVAVAVQPDSPIKDWKDLVARMKKDPASVTLGSSNRAGAAPLIFAMAIKAAGIDPAKMKLVVFNSAGEAMTAGLGGHVDVVVITSETVKLQLIGKKTRVLAISAAKRPASGAFATVPTLTEQGVNVVFGSWRLILGAKGMTQAQTAYWEGLFAKLVASEDWKQELDNYDASNEYMNSADTRRFLDTQYAQLKEVLTELGLAK